MSSSPAAAEAFPYFLAQLEAGMAGRDEDDPGPRRRPDLPAWAAQLVGVLFDGQDAAAARDWARRVHGELGRLGGRVPLGVVHDWHARVVAPMLAEASVRHGGAAGPHHAVRLLHTRTLAGERVPEADWTAALEPALREVYRHAYGYADACATAGAQAHAYAIANGFGEERAAEFAETYAQLNTGANARSYADANALANARALAAAYTAGDARAYARTYPFARVQAYAHAHAGRDGAAGQEERHRAAYGRLADGLADSLARTAA
ncbi:SpcZ [Streptomyces celluloflavus]